ncbi:MAG: winged helix-turn-helix transcriptional regulator [Labilithrix sp.]|nr:winged helix-turn-helix transcriptional regulator [Labilithrix sp.]
MVEQRADPLSTVFRALGDPTRRAMLRRLSSGEHTVTELAEPFEMSLAAASKHVQVLERAGLVLRTVQGRKHHCRLVPARLAQAQQWLAFYERFWNNRLDALSAMFVPRAAKAAGKTVKAAPPESLVESATTAGTAKRKTMRGTVHRRRR